MLRRQINNMEYVALTESELQLINKNQNHPEFYFIVPSIKMQRGYYVTEMLPIHYGKITTIDGNRINFESRPSVVFRPTNKFIRWSGCNWRRERDSNPRYVAVYTLSRRAPSATRPPPKVA